MYQVHLCGAHEVDASCGRGVHFEQALVHGMQNPAGIVQLGRDAVRLRSLGDPGFPADQKQD